MQCFPQLKVKLPQLNFGYTLLIKSFKSQTHRERRRIVNISINSLNRKARDKLSFFSRKVRLVQSQDWAKKIFLCITSTQSGFALNANKC